MRGVLLLGLFASACAGGSDSRAANDSTAVAAPAPRPDSAGWRFTYVAGPRLWLRYPIGRVLGVRDEWKPDCDKSVPLFANDSARSFVDSIIVRAAPAPFDSAVAIAGFVRHVEGRDTTYGLDNLEDATSFDWADTMTVGSWRALSGLVVSLAYIDSGDSVTYDAPESNPGATLPPSRLFARRVAAVGPGIGRCVTLLAMQTHTVLHTTDTEPLGASMARAMLAGLGTR